MPRYTNKLLSALTRATAAFDSHRIEEHQRVLGEAQVRIDKAISLLGRPPTTPPAAWRGEPPPSGHEALQLIHKWRTQSVRRRCSIIETTEAASKATAAAIREMNQRFDNTPRWHDRRDGTMMEGVVDVAERIQSELADGFSMSEPSMARSHSGGMAAKAMAVSEAVTALRKACFDEQQADFKCRNHELSSFPVGALRRSLAHQQARLQKRQQDLHALTAKLQRAAEHIVKMNQLLNGGSEQPEPFDRLVDVEPTTSPIQPRHGAADMEQQYSVADIEQRYSAADIEVEVRGSDDETRLELAICADGLVEERRQQLALELGTALDDGADKQRAPTFTAHDAEILIRDTLADTPVAIDDATPDEEPPDDSIALKRYAAPLPTGTNNSRYITAIMSWPLYHGRHIIAVTL